MTAPDRRFDGHEPVADGLAGLRELVSPYGLVSSVRKLPSAAGEPDFSVHLGNLGSPSQALDNLDRIDPGEDTGNADGAGSGLNPDRAELIAVAESLERYSSSAWHDDDFVVATIEEMGADAVAPERFPRCSPTERSDPACGPAAYDPREPIRWKRAWSLTRNRAVHVPAIAVHLHMPYASDGERFIRGISTGAAVHTDVRAATLNGVLEVVERDAIAVLWLQQLPLPEIDLEDADLPPYVAEHRRRGDNGALRLRVFDATTDFGVPVLYGVQLNDDDPQLAQIVAATCGTEPGAALAKLYRELSSVRIALRGHLAAHGGRSPESGKVSVIGGAVLNGPPERRHVLDFLLRNEGRPRRSLADLDVLDHDTDPLDDVVRRLAHRGAEVIVADITTDEARQAGMAAVKVLVPEAVPVSFMHAERFLATPRLYSAPTAMGFEARPEHLLNPEHQPFA